MGTPCYICKKESTDSFKGIYVHWDGYPKYMEPLLLNHYNTEDKVDQLISMGAASYITGKIGDTRNDFSDPDRDICCFYHRDRDEDLQIEKFTRDELNVPGFYVYVFVERSWYLVDLDNWVLLTEEF